MKRPTLNDMGDALTCHRLEMKTEGKVRVPKIWSRQIEWLADKEDAANFVYLIQGDGWVVGLPKEEARAALGISPEDEDDMTPAQIARLGLIMLPGKWTTDNNLTVPDRILYHLNAEPTLPFKFWTLTCGDRFLLLNDACLTQQSEKLISSLPAPFFDD
jgi:hypothetical protein